MSGGAVKGEGELALVEGVTVDCDDDPDALDGGSSDLATVLDARVVAGSSGANTTEAFVVLGLLDSEVVLVSLVESGVGS